MTKGVLCISYMLDGDYNKVGIWLLAIAIMAIFVLVASVIDLHWGIRASKRIGKFKTTSYGLRKTAGKDKVYLTLYFFAIMIDACLSFFVPIPVVSVLVCVAEIMIEGKSVHEKMEMLRSTDIDPLYVAKAIANTYGVHDAQKIQKVLDTLEKSTTEIDKEDA